MNRTLVISAVAALALAAPATASAAAPKATTGGANHVTFGSATVNATINPEGLPTSYSFQYGTSKAYGNQTVTAFAASDSKNHPESAAISGLLPVHTYHYRVIANNSSGTVVGADQSFKTSKQPLGLALSTPVNPVPFGQPAALAGTLSGTGNAGQTIILQANAFPFTAGFAQLGNAVVTDAAGNFSVTVPALTQTTQFRAVSQSAPSVTSPVITVGSRVVVSMHVKHESGGKVHFSGLVTPKETAGTVSVQRFSKHGAWTTVARGLLKASGASHASYSVTVGVHHRGTYRVLARGISDGHIEAASPRRVLNP